MFNFFFFFFLLIFETVHGSAASLISGGSSLYGSAEDRQVNEVRRLKRELCDAREQVMSLSSQLSSNVSRKRLKYFNETPKYNMLVVIITLLRSKLNEIYT